MVHSRKETQPIPAVRDTCGEPMMPVPTSWYFWRTTELVPVRWVRATALLCVGSTLIFTQLVMWVGWEREPSVALMSAGVGLMLGVGAMNLDEKRRSNGSA